MGRGHVAKATIVELQNKIALAKKQKKQLILYIHKLKKKYSQQQISYSKYIEILYKRVNGKNIKQWIDYYDDYIKECEKLIQKQKSQLIKNKTQNWVLIFGLLFILLTAAYYIDSRYTGFAIGDNLTETLINETNFTIPEQNITETSEINITENITESEELEISEDIQTEEKEVPEDLEEVIPSQELPGDQPDQEQEPLEEKDLTIETIQYTAILGQPVKWKKHIELNKPEKIKIELPQQAENITINKKIKELQKKEIPDQEIIEITLDENETQLEIEYETPAPYAIEEDTATGKKVKIIGPTSIHYENVLIYTELNENLNIKNPSKVKIFWEEQNQYIPIQNIEDLNSNGIYDYIEFIAPHLSNQTFRIILITKAEYLDSNRTFLNNIYDEVKELDNIWSEEIPSSHYVRATFEENLTSENDITVYPRIISGNPIIEVYEFNDTELIAEFENLNNNQYNKVFLTNLISESQDVFDLRVVGGSIEFDHIIDPLTELFYDGGEIADGWVAGDTTCPSNPWDTCSQGSDSGGTLYGATTLHYDGAQSIRFEESANAYLTKTIDTRGYEEVNLSFCWAQDNLDASETGTISVDGVVLDTISRADPSTDNAWECMEWALIANEDLVPSATTIFRFDMGNNGAFEGNEEVFIDLFNVTGHNAPDLIKPDLTITFPNNNTNWSDNLLDVNFTANDETELFNCWYSNDTYSVNTTIDCGGNITTLTWTEGQHNVTVWANDTAGNINQTSIKFTIDLTNPSLTILSPLNNTHHTNSNHDINYTVGDINLETCWWSNDSYTKNNTITCGENITTVVWIDGQHNFTIWTNDSAGNQNQTSINFTITGDSSPEIVAVYNATMTDVSSGLNSGPFKTSVLINFSVTDIDGVEDINISTALINFTKTDEDIRQNTSCAVIDWTGTNANFTCNITMWWWDSSGTWAIGAYIEDNSSNAHSNISADFQVGQTIGFELSPGNLTWSTLSPGSYNQTASNNPLLLNNTGNKDINLNEIGINATDLLGEEDSNYGLWAANFSVNWSTGGSPPAECGGTNLTHGRYANITGANLTAGNYTQNDQITGQEELYFCIKYIGSELTSQPYSTKTYGSWTIRILLVAIIPKKRKKERKEKIIGELSIPLTIFSNKLGALETITKYLKENLKLNYNEIAEILNRNQKTIWTSYKKALEKQKSIIKIEKTTIFIPTKILKNRNLTILESIIVYLKEKGLKYSEISKLLNRDQRNIWTIYSRTIKK